MMQVINRFRDVACCFGDNFELGNPNAQDHRRKYVAASRRDVRQGLELFQSLRKLCQSRSSLWCENPGKHQDVVWKARNNLRDVGYLFWAKLATGNFNVIGIPRFDSDFEFFGNFRSLEMNGGKPGQCGRQRKDCGHAFASSIRTLLPACKPRRCQYRQYCSDALDPSREARVIVGSGDNHRPVDADKKQNADSQRRQRQLRYLAHEALIA